MENEVTTKVPLEIPEQEEELAEEIIYEEQMSWSEVIHCVFAAISSIDDIDIAMASPMDRKRIKRIKRKGLRLIDVGIGEIYAEKFELETDEKQDDNEED
jgi:hypothetical protein